MMRALQITDSGDVAICDASQPEPRAGQVLVKISAAALNHRDQWIREGKYPNIQPYVTLGSDGCGKVVEWGPNTDPEWHNQDVVINPNINWGEDPMVQSSDYQVLGMPTDGTLAEYIVVDQDRLAVKPAHLTAEEAAAIPLAGLTAYRALFNHGGLAPGQELLITGAGGGVSQMAFVLAKAKGADISVTTGSTEKMERMKKLGAKEAYHYRQEWDRDASAKGQKFDLVVDSTGGAQLNALIKLVKPGGRIVSYGATIGLPPKIDLYRMFWNQIRLQGSTMGNDQEFREMIALVNQQKIKPLIDSVTPFHQAIQALDKMQASQQFGKLVLSMD